MAVKIFCCYAHEDETYLKRLQVQLKPLQRQGLINLWHDRDISAGTEWEQEISKQLDAAQIILLLISPDFMASDYCYGTELKRAIDRHKRKEARVIPIILRPASWEGVIGNLQALPTDAKPIASPGWHSSDEAFFDIEKGVYKVVQEISQQTLPDNTAKPPIKETDVQIIKDQFHQAMIGIYKDADKIGYKATLFIHMVNTNGGVETAHQLLAKDTTDGFTRLWEKKRLDLSVEALVLRPQFAALFDETEREQARKKLAEYKYKAPWDIN